MEEKNKINKGRPAKYKPEYAEQAYELCLIGVNDAQLAGFFEVDLDTIKEWKKMPPQLSATVKK